LASCPIACSTGARSPALEAVVVAFGRVRRSLVHRSPIGACQRARALAIPRNPGRPGR
jgi:hypothetical protein